MYEFILPTDAFQVGGERQDASRPAQGFQAESPDPEGFALQVPDTVLRRHVLQLLEMLPGEPPARGHENDDSKSFTTGSYSFGGGIAGLRKNRVCGNCSVPGIESTPTQRFRECKNS